MNTNVNVNQQRPSLMQMRSPIAEIAQTVTRVVEQIVDRVEDMRAQQDARRAEPPMPCLNPTASNASNDPSMHTVKAGETMESIAAAKGMNVDELKRMNPQVSNAPLSAGQQLVVAPDAQEAAGTTSAEPASMSNIAGDAPTAPVTGDLPADSASGPLDLQDVYKRYQGGSYVYGGGRDGNGFGVPGEKNSDCSAFVSAVWKEKGLDLPAHTDAAYNKLKGLGAQETTSAPKPGDVVFWMGAGTGGGISHHMGIYMGDGKVLQQTGANGGGVQVLPMPKSGVEALRDPRLTA